MTNTEPSMSPLERTTIAYVVIVALFMMTLPFWNPARWLGITVGVMSFVIGIVLATLLVKLRRTL